MPRFTKCFEIMVAATLEKNLGSPMPKRSDDSSHQEKEESWTTRTHSMKCQIYVVNKKPVPQLS